MTEVVQLMGVAVKSVPELFTNCINGVMAILKRSVQSINHELLHVCIGMLVDMTPKFGQQMLPFIEGLYALFMQLLRHSVCKKVGSSRRRARPSTTRRSSSSRRRSSRSSPTSSAPARRR